VLRQFQHIDRRRLKCDRGVFVIVRDRDGLRKRFDKLIRAMPAQRPLNRIDRDLARTDFEQIANQVNQTFRVGARLVRNRVCQFDFEKAGARNANAIFEIFPRVA